MAAELMTLAELRRRLYEPASAEQLSPLFGCDAVLLDLRDESAAALAAAPARVYAAPVVARVRPGQPVPDCVDVACVDDAEVDAVLAGITASPHASLVLVQLLRANAASSVEDGLFAESLAYSTLQHGERFQAWLASRVPKPPQLEPGPLVRVEQEGAAWVLTLDRPAKRNAYSAALRDALVDALQFAAVADSAAPIVLRGAGANFSAGGDLDEFGQARDAAAAHAVRMTRSAARLVHTLRARVTCELHGACVGAGIELPAFAGRVVARPGSYFVLPEVGFGLVPGAGGTVSILHRIGRLRLARIAITGERVDVETALAWGLINAVL